MRCKRCGCTPDGHNALRELADHVLLVAQERDRIALRPGGLDQGVRELADAARAAIALAQDEAGKLFDPADRS